ncbi:MAG: hypothetical protein CUN53_19580 [Phototrophicales bacterium]|nr:MAG: hypothetical protein CUN53_19580 [Phototrophicales bacterium]
MADHNKSFSMALAAQINAQLAQLTNRQQYWDDAIRHAQQLTRRDPNSIGAWRRLADILWMRGDHHQAAAAYQRALECDRNFELDEFKQLSERERAAIIERIKEATR